LGSLPLLVLAEALMIAAAVLLDLALGAIAPATRLGWA
jgi:hypothetical protein